MEYLEEYETEIFSFIDIHEITYNHIVKEILVDEFCIYYGLDIEEFNTALVQYMKENYED